MEWLMSKSSALGSRGQSTLQSVSSLSLAQDWTTFPGLLCTEGWPRAEAWPVWSRCPSGFTQCMCPYYALALLQEMMERPASLG